MLLVVLSLSRSKSCVGFAGEALPTLHEMQQESAWPSVMIGHQPQDGPGSVPPKDRHQDLVYLANEKLLSDESVQAIESFCSFMLICLV